MGPIFVNFSLCLTIWKTRPFKMIEGVVRECKLRGACTKPVTLNASSEQARPTPRQRPPVVRRVVGQRYLQFSTSLTALGKGRRNSIQPRLVGSNHLTE